LTSQTAVSLRCQTQWDVIPGVGEPVEESLSGAECRFLGASEGAVEVRRLIRIAAGCSEPVLVWGPTGTGKGLVAEEIHRLSARNGRPFVTIDCAALSGGLLESELFGYEKGAYTGATRASAGLFLAAEAGTVFIDELQELDMAQQARLLRVLEKQVVRPLAGNRERRVNARVVAAMSVQPSAAVDEKTLRAELYFRLRVIEIRLAPLAERPEDVALLVEHFKGETERVLERKLSLTHGADSELCRYHWPGNVRQIRNLLRSLAFCEESPIHARHVRRHLQGTEAPCAAGPFRLDEVIACALKRAMTAAGGNKTRAAELLAIRVERLRRLLKRYGLGGAVSSSRSLVGAS